MLFHIAPETEVAAARPTGEYRPAAFASEGFIHCSHASQVAAVADRLFRGRTGLVLLEIDSRKLACPIVEENLDGGVELFPHVYGTVPFEAVARIHQFPCGEDGSFALPRAIADRTP